MYGCFLSCQKSWKVNYYCGVKCFEDLMINLYTIYTLTMYNIAILSYYKNIILHC